MRARGKGRSAPKPPGTSFVAHRPTARQLILTTSLVCLALVLISILFPAGPRAPWLPDPEPTLEWTLLLSGIGTLFAFVMLCLMGYQRVHIDGSAIRVKSTATMFRWQSFDASEVRTIRYTGTGFQNMSICLYLRLAPEANGDVRVVPFASASWWSESAAIDNPVYLAVVAAVARAHPGIVVENLPADYAGPLRSPALLI